MQEATPYPAPMAWVSATSGPQGGPPPTLPPRWSDRGALLIGLAPPFKTCLAASHSAASVAAPCLVPKAPPPPYPAPLNAFTYFSPYLSPTPSGLPGSRQARTHSSAIRQCTRPGQASRCGTAPLRAGRARHADDSHSFSLGASAAAKSAAACVASPGRGSRQPGGSIHPTQSGSSMAPASAGSACPCRPPGTWGRRQTFSPQPQLVGTATGGTLSDTDTPSHPEPHHSEEPPPVRG